MTITTTSTPGEPHISEHDVDLILATDHIYRTVSDLLDNGEYEDG